MSDAKTRARPTREQVEQAKRRRRADFLDHSHNQRLPVDASKLDTQNFTYRFFNDEPGRVSRHTQQDDWDAVTSEEIGGGEVRHFVGYHPDGSPLYAQLMKKPKLYHQADQNAKIARSQEEERELLRRVPAASGGLDAKGYTDPNLNRISGGVTRIDGDPDLGAMRERDDA